MNQQEDSESAARWLKSLPLVRSVETFPADNASCTIIHAGQIHNVPEATIVNNPEYLQSVAAVQEIIFRIRTNAQARFSLPYYYSEAVTRELVSATKRADVRPTEDGLALIRGWHERQRLINLGQIVVEEDSPIMNPREYAVLRNIASDRKQGMITDHFAFLVFGPSHDFSDNIRIWNSTNAFKFSLIAVTP